MDSNTIVIIATAGIGIVVGAVLSYFLVRPRVKNIENTANAAADQIINNARSESKKISDDARAYVQQVKDSVHREEEKSRKRMEDQQVQADERIAKREELLEQKMQKADNARDEYERRSLGVDEKKKELQVQVDEQSKKLADIAGLSKTDAKEKLFKNLEKELAADMGKKITKAQAEAEKVAEEEASNIIVQSIQRMASGITAESTVSVVKIESDDIKGRIIGKEGRNINAFEMMSGVDVIIDDTPNSITISSFDMFRRYVAKMALEELVKDGRIHPSSIEEAIKKAEESADKLILDIGKKAAEELNYPDLPDPVLKLIGRLRFRTSYGQNVLSHSIEVAYIAEAIARELGADGDVCRQSGLVHDIGKAVSHEVEGGHALIGRDILKKFGCDDAIIKAMESHHEDVPYTTIESRILQAADAISASRPGARRENLEKYIRRLKQLETIAAENKGVSKAYAIQAGREVRVFVKSDMVDDAEAAKLAHDIAKEIEKDCDYPGEVKVAVIRESRFEDFAR